LRNLKADRRFSGRIFWLAAGAALAIVLALAPSPLAAQGNPASSAAESSATFDAPTDVKQQPVLSDEEKQNQAFRLQPEQREYRQNLRCYQLPDRFSGYRSPAIPLPAQVPAQSQREVEQRYRVGAEDDRRRKHAAERG